MDLLTTLLVGVPAQVAVFALVPLAWWLQASRPDGSFLRWLGFTPVTDGRDPLVLAATVVCGLGFFGGALIGGTGPWTSTGSGLAVVLAVAVTAVFQTALAEELFFRGFLLRWLGERRSGPLVANVLQALACGVLRLVMHWLFVDREPAAALVAMVLGVGSAFLAGWLRQRTGSLLLSWAAHGAGNLLAGLVALVLR
ncbi:CPBP family intramembrane glutamic endopeptidase [Micropruina sonneratiae]|uniref:CPBP family intramembrane glutamic endopeptidase n=1 Tax=Micropruina sonneratiae TaxID=2986940 RepID=UPI002227066A|nr:CPBP family intramembrane glutamic endopeptidase [Micropruina sp. KQZ13P-5]MCW3158681.1 CPBP family intramembrane metalloprotease [Micropruina sp. KQZ13P-5]